ncbi:uncharacterized protein LOC120278836 [Dioscorea cayenensis subsp. rotundata]|uniref:Uncharacterized protein LOC120278836 n=1 Tax=Dioscorea cayennensis subsp. rotundata TaxID=55577 RepID=A0AB40CN48_DIOCR|nr:uncharacterized protein LOC120278836 [Dioscorea cayenensis subsp. rotundata]
MRNMKEQGKGRGRGKGNSSLHHAMPQRSTRTSAALAPIIQSSNEAPPSTPEVQINLPTIYDHSPTPSNPVCGGLLMSENDGSSKSSSRGPSVGLPYPLNPNDRVHLTPINADVFVEKGVTTTVTCIIKKHFKGPWPTWRKVPSDVKELMWKTFQEYCKWNLEHNSKIKNVFDKTGKTRLRDMLADERMKAMKEVGATNIRECKGMDREWITKDVWDALINNEWGTDAW